MNELQIFKYENNDVRTVEINGEPWFVLKDVCGVLGLSDTGRTAERLDADELTRTTLVSGGQNREMICISESGLYNVILRSDKPEAKPFRKWVTAEVLPTIRRHGAYMTPETLQAAILNPDTMIQLCQQLKAEQDKNAALSAANSQLMVDKQIMLPKAEYFDELVDRNLLTSFRETAKQLGIGEKPLSPFAGKEIHLPRQKGKLMPYADKNNGLFEVKECFNENPLERHPDLDHPKGREVFRLLYLKAAC